LAVSIFTVEYHLDGGSRLTNVFKNDRQTDIPLRYKYAKIRKVSSLKSFFCSTLKLQNYFAMNINLVCRSQWPRGLRSRSSAARLLRLWVRIPPAAWIFVCCVLSGRDVCDGLITRPEESYRLWRVVVCDQETSKTRRLKPATGL
jgi:hypothetical protein